jgi:hypothetical protein
VEDMILQGTFTDVVLHEVGSILLFFYVFVWGSAMLDFERL